MNAVAVSLAIALGCAGCGSLAGLLTSGPWRSRVVGVLTALSGVAGVAAGASAATGTTWQASLPGLLALSGSSFAVDALSGWFLLLVGCVCAAAGVYTIGYAGRDGRGPGSRAAMAVLPVFCAAMVMVPVAASVSTFLLVWELMALTSLTLVLTEHRHSSAVRSAGIWYAAMTQGGFVLILLGLTWLAAATGSESFMDIHDRAPALSPAVAGGVFVLCLVGFVSKAGAVPLHPWLPRAHAEAPSHVSALMSAAMVKLGVYALIRVGFDLLDDDSWWWLLVAALGALSASYGIMQAVVATDIKRLLAFSTSENIGLILLGVGFAGMLANAGQNTAAAVALAAALLHSVNHAGFKTLLFFGAGSVVRATGTRDLDRLGGLSRRMPATTALFTAGALGAAALPLGNGFVSEWLLLQSMLHPSTKPGTLLAIVAPIAVAVVALTAGVGVAAYVKAVGTGLLARPRSDAAAGATESPPSMLVAMGAAAATCAALAAVPGLTAPALSRIVASMNVGPGPFDANVLNLRLVGISGTIAPLWIAAALVGLILAIVGLARALGRPRKRADAWDCGDGPLTARMEYTATSFAEPLQRVFDNVLAPEQDVDVTHAIESAYHTRAVRYRQRIPDRLENRLYRPLIKLFHTVGQSARRLASGSMHRYLAYMLTALIVVLVAGIIR